MQVKSFRSLFTIHTKLYWKCQCQTVLGAAVAVLKTRLGCKRYLTSEFIKEINVQRFPYKR